MGWSQPGRASQAFSQLQGIALDLLCQQKNSNLYHCNKMGGSACRIYLPVQFEQKMCQENAINCSLVNLAASPYGDYKITHSITEKLNKVLYLKQANHKLVKTHRPKHYSTNHKPSREKKTQTCWNLNYRALKRHHQQLQSNKSNYSMLLLAAKKIYANLSFGKKKKMVRAPVVARTIMLTVKMLM